MARHHVSLALLLALLAGGALGQAPALPPAMASGVPLNSGQRRRCGSHSSGDVELPPADGEADDQPATKIVYANNGTAVEFARGTMIGYARMTGPCDPPAAIGVELTTGIQEGLPNGKMVLHYLPFFKDEAPGWNPFPVAEVDWAPNGHEAPGWVGGRSGRVRSLVRRARRCWQALDAAPLDSGMYTVPHWDFHFYLTPKEEIDMIKPGTFSPPPTSPCTGNHYVNTQSPEFGALMTGGNAEEAWNETWIWGAYDCEISFFEVMAKRAWLADSPSLCSPIPNMPTEFSIAGYKPSTYCVITTDETTLIELRDFKWYDAACTSGMWAPASYLSLPPGSPPLEAECIAPKMGAAGTPTGTPMATPAPAPTPSAASRTTVGALAALAAVAVALLALRHLEQLSASVRGCV
ncbi:DNA polymerase eta isoform B [Micractinium conductrix]|uniref:DNA polymerase eta isoform B n=1 Tax=Micractinium conductrix TaxID=554055 RepID=A0A2P6V1H0_9CHLO|nr:DNA polymerase eta isoform B [Micractinium conductrix]|eukprot:PSC67941.1 DNA polymerase eta isoform B [Micractinium conductrix]